MMVTILIGIPIVAFGAWVESWRRSRIAEMEGLHDLRWHAEPEMGPEPRLAFALSVSRRLASGCWAVDQVTLEIRPSESEDEVVARVLERAERVACTAEVAALAEQRRLTNAARNLGKRASIEA
jgi:hypothetical protein